jgi:hypothetical protein
VTTKKSPLGTSLHKLYSKLPQQDDQFFGLFKKKDDDEDVSLRWLERAVNQGDINIAELSRLDIFSVLSDLMMYEDAELLHSSFDVYY